MMHTFRLLHMAEEIAVDRRIIVNRPDRKHLLDIKEGKFQYDVLVTKAEELKERLSSLYKESFLPDIPDMNKINILLAEIRETFYQKGEQLN